MKVITLVFSLLLLVSIGFGQSRTVKQQEIVNATANWVSYAETDKGDKHYINLNNVSKAITLAFFEVKMENNGVLMYATIAVNCIEDTYLATNVFVQATPTGKLVRMPQYDMKGVAEIGDGGLQEAAEYACKNGKELK
jgi:hypothetical protein